MSQFPHAPPIPPQSGPGVPPPYAQPSQSPYSTSQGQGQYYSQPPNAISNQPSSGNNYVPQYVPPATQNHASTPSAIGQMFNQAVTTGKPVWQKLTKSVGQKLNKQPLSSTHATSSPQNAYQPQQYQSAQQQIPQQAGTQPSNWQSPAYHNSQQSPYPPSNYPTPSPVQNSYFPPQQHTQASTQPQLSQQHQQQQQQQQPIQQQQPPIQPTFTQTASSYNQYGSTEHNTSMGNPQGIPHQESIVGNSMMPQYAQNMSPMSPPQPYSATPFSSNSTDQMNQWTSVSAGMTSASPVNQSAGPPSTPQHAPTFTPTPPPQAYSAAPVPTNNTEQTQQWGSMGSGAPPPASPNNPNTTYPASSSQHPAGDHQVPPDSNMQNVRLTEGAQSQPPVNPANNQPEKAPSTPNEFIAELPADIGGLTVGGPHQEANMSSNLPQNPAQQYQLYQQIQHSQSSQPMQSSQSQQPFTVSRRALSDTSKVTPIGPWRIADPNTEEPTKEFFSIADLLYDGLDRNCEPKNTGILEATKILESWRAQEMAEDAAQLFSHDSFRAFAHLWALEGIPHLMVPVQPSLTPSWSVQPKPYTLKISPELPAPNAPYASYVPALNRSGWYKYLFLELVGDPEGLEKLMPRFCADTYNPSGAGHPDLSRRERNEPAPLSARANQIRTGAIARACQEAADSINVANTNSGNVQIGHDGGISEAEIAAKMQSLHIQNQMSNMANQAMIAGGQSFSTAAGNTYVPRF
ncbi:hypothetical protein AOQ84DRAFT_391883 [Glonium stellatum]|uniref:Uncharacterized protein n=1 Tax=Glonium stellatum TaxID=574774 RepID=A0A8E2JNQ1_9PEZI|nr:hypothetical protein AOQ84DRAFT_391883 [Glonium stellatum]